VLARHGFYARASGVECAHPAFQVFGMCAEVIF
jgi:hypothetical protein